MKNNYILTFGEHGSHLDTWICIRGDCRSHEVKFILGSKEWDIPLLWLSWKKHPRHVITWHHLSSCLSSWDDQHTPLVLRQELCAGQHWEASEPQIVALWRWIPNSPSQDSVLLAVNYTARNEVKWHYLHNMGASSIFINSADRLYSLERGSAILGNGYK